MQRMNNKDTMRIYEVPGRTLSVVQGNSGVVYPFYTSSGINSGSSLTWFPWMGYFEKHPEAKDSIYMLKPTRHSLSEGLQRIIRKHMEQNKQANFISRIGNDEALAISCCIGGGIWEENPEFRQAIMNSEPVQPYLKKFQIEYSQVSKHQKSKSTDKLCEFKGRYYSGLVQREQAEAASEMERLTAQEEEMFVSEFSVAAKQQFPTSKDLQVLLAKQHSAQKEQDEELGLENKPPRQRRFAVSYTNLDDAKKHSYGQLDKDKQPSTPRRGRTQAFIITDQQKLEAFRQKYVDLGDKEEQEKEEISHPRRKAMAPDEAKEVMQHFKASIPANNQEDKEVNDRVTNSQLQ